MGGSTIQNATTIVSDDFVGNIVLYNNDTLKCTSPSTVTITGTDVKLENSVKHLKEAGLNPALFYAKGGQGGATGGGQAQGVGLPSTTPTMARIQAQGMGAQLQNKLSQVELNKATAKKTEAEAEKIAGADTKVAEREAEMLKSQSAFVS